MIPRTLKQAKKVGGRASIVKYDKLSDAEKKEWIVVSGRPHDEVGLISRSLTRNRRQVCWWDKNIGAYVCYYVDET
jgi:hypothetical protein